jgi:hypothetical protein
MGYLSILEVLAQRFVTPVQPVIYQVVDDIFVEIMVLDVSCRTLQISGEKTTGNPIAFMVNGCFDSWSNTVTFQIRRRGLR